VAVIVPVRDRRDLLAACLDAVAPQVRGLGEVVVVDDGSSDGSRELAEARAAAGDPVRVLDAGGAGAVAARSLGVAATTAPVLAFTDSDCVPEPGWLAAGLAAVDAGAEMVVGITLPARAPGLHERTVTATVEDGLYATCNLFVTRDAFEAAGGFDAEAGARLGSRPGPALRGLGFGEDTMLGWRIRRAGRVRALAAGAVVRHHVFGFEAREHVQRAWQAGGFCGLVREVPELRGGPVLRHGVFLGTARRVPLYLAVLGLLAGRRRVAAAGVAVWLGWHARDVARVERAWSRRVKVLPVVAAGDAVTAASLVVAGVRTRSPVL
jgi:hypothetical protein